MSKQQTNRTSTNPESGWFGFRPVAASEKTGLVQGVFQRVASRYDVMNDVMSLGIHRLWKDDLVRQMAPRAGEVHLDVAGGTGDVALRVWRKTEGKAKITVCDLNPDMLAAGKKKALDQGVVRGIQWVHGNAEELPVASNSVDIYSIVFGLRNVTRIDVALAEAVRVLKPGGRFFCMEFSPGVDAGIKPLYDAYCLNILPVMGQVVANDRDAYQYLAESIQQFPTQDNLAKRMKKAGMDCISWRNLMGGLAVIHSGRKL